MNTQRNHESNIAKTGNILHPIDELEEFFSLALDPFCIAGTDGYFKKVNPAFATLLEYSEEELLSRPIIDFVHEEDIEVTLRKQIQLEEGLDISFFENRFIKKSGEYCWLLWSMRLSSETGVIYAAAKDNTAQRLAETALFESERRYKSIFSSTPLPLWIYDVETMRFLDVNQKAIAHYGYSIGEFLRINLLDIYHPQERQKVFHLIKSGILYHHMPSMLSRHVKKNGEEIIVEVTSTAITYKGKQATLSIINDISEKVKLQEKLQNEELIQERKIVQATITAQEREREFLGKELHDNINQILTSTKLYLDVALENKGQQNALIEKSKENLIYAINEIRALSKSLVPSSLKDLSFTDAIEELLTPYWTRNLFVIQFLHTGPLNNMSDDLKLALFRIMQEQLTNITKHAKAKNVWLNLSYQDQIVLTVKDDGKGFDPEAKREGIGISNIRNRARMHQGSVDIVTEPGKGCLLKVVIPVEKMYEPENKDN